MVMKKENMQKIFALMIISVFMFSILPGVVKAQEETPTGGPEIDVGKNQLTEWWGGVKGYFEKPGSSGTTVKVLFWILVTLLLIMFSMFVIKKARYLALIIPVSALISYLLIAYLTPEEIWGLLQSYSALGLALITLIPLAILVGMTYSAAVTASGLLRVIQFLGWISYLFFLIYRFVFRLIEGKLHVTLGIALLIAVIAIIFNGVIYGKIRNQIVESRGKESGRTMREAASAATHLAEFEEETAEGGS